MFWPATIIKGQIITNEETSSLPKHVFNSVISWYFIEQNLDLHSSGMVCSVDW
jgi:hypothetical protein